MKTKKDKGVCKKFEKLTKLQQLEVLALAVTLKSLQIASQPDQQSFSALPDPADREVR